MRRVVFKIGEGKSCYFIENQYIISCKNEAKIYNDLCELNKYVKNDFFLRVRLDQTKCIFTDEDIGHYETWLTDGIWVWSYDLVHYSENYFFQWPEEFINHITSRNYRLDFDMERLFIIGDEFRQNFDLKECYTLT